MAASGKKGKKKWKQFDFQDTTPARKPTVNWADEVDLEFDVDSFDNRPEKICLPSAPRASRGTTIDESKVPLNAPFQAYLSNIPYDLTELELTNFFQNLKVKSVRIPRDEKGNKAKGYGYIEFEDRASLISALSLGENPLKGRPLRIELTTNVDSGNRGGGRGGRGNRDGGRSEVGGGGSDRTAGNWRSGPRSDDFEDRGGGGGSGYDRGGYGYGNRREFSSGGGGSGGGFNRGMEDRGSFYREDRGGGGMDRERYGRDDRRDGGGRDDHKGGGFNQGGFDRGGGFGRDRDDRSFNRDRDDRGYSRDRDERSFTNFNDRSDRSYSRRDEDRYRDDRGNSDRWRDETNYNRMDDRRDRDNRYGGRREGLPPIDRGERGERNAGGGGGGGPAEVKTRPKLNLRPRTKSSAAEGDGTEEPVGPASIFGGARPVDTAAREREIEERLRRGGDDGADMRSKSGPTSSSGGGGNSSQKDINLEKRTEPAPPPKENAWSRKPQSSSTTVVNNGRSSPEDVRQGGGGGGGHASDNEEKTESRTWARGGDSRRQEPRRIEEPRPRAAQHKGGTGGNISSEKSKGKDEKPANKHRDGRREIDDISRMPKIQEAKVLNFEASNKFSTLDSDEAPLE